MSKQDPRDLREEGTFLKDMSVGSVPCAEAPGEPPGRETSGESSRSETSVRAISVPSFFIHASSEHLFTDGHPGAGGPGRQGLRRGTCPPEAGQVEQAGGSQHSPAHHVSPPRWLCFPVLGMTLQMFAERPARRGRRYVQPREQ